MLRPKQLYIVVPLLALFALSGNNTKQFLRRLATDCIHNVYATPENARNIPAVPESSNDGLPAYISLCQQWLRNDACKLVRSLHMHSSVYSVATVSTFPPLTYLYVSYNKI